MPASITAARGPPASGEAKASRRFSPCPRQSAADAQANAINARTPQCGGLSGAVQGGAASAALPRSWLSSRLPPLPEPALRLLPHGGRVQCSGVLGAQGRRERRMVMPASPTGVPASLAVQCRQTAPNARLHSLSPWRSAGGREGLLETAPGCRCANEAEIGVLPPPGGLARQITVPTGSGLPRDALALRRATAALNRSTTAARGRPALPKKLTLLPSRLRSFCPKRRCVEPPTAPGCLAPRRGEELGVERFNNVCRGRFPARSRMLTLRGEGRFYAAGRQSRRTPRHGHCCPVRPMALRRRPHAPGSSRSSIPKTLHRRHHSCRAAETSATVPSRRTPCKTPCHHRQACAAKEKEHPQPARDRSLSE
jgi:hypothetical protein